MVTIDIMCQYLDRNLKEHSAENWWFGSDAVSHLERMWRLINIITKMVVHVVLFG